MNSNRAYTGEVRVSEDDEAAALARVILDRFEMGWFEGSAWTPVASAWEVAQEIRPHLVAALRAEREAEFERLYGKIVLRISADIAGDFDAALDQLEYNAREAGKAEGRREVLEEAAQAYGAIFDAAFWQDLGNGHQCRGCWQYKNEPHRMDCWVELAVIAVGREQRNRALLVEQPPSKESE